MKYVLAALIGVISYAVSGAAAEPARELTNKEVKELLKKASTAQDHLRFAAHFAAKAKKYEAESAEHADMAKMYRVQPTVSEVKRLTKRWQRLNRRDTAQNIELVRTSDG
jgi:hypothetical protein